jgi:hypothetical protein
MKRIRAAKKRQYPEGSEQEHGSHERGDKMAEKHGETGDRKK